MDALQRRGTPAAPGIAAGTIVHYLRQRASVSDERIEPDQVDAELDRLERAIDQARGDLTRDRAAMAVRAGPEEAAIFDAHELMLDDPALTGDIARRVRDDQISATQATLAVSSDLQATFEALDDEYLRARSADIRDVAARILAALSKNTNALAPLPERTIVVAEELFPSDTSLLDIDRVVGFITERGSPTAHIAILARSLDIASVVGVADALSELPSGAPAILDGTSGTVTINPTPEDMSNALSAEDAQRVERARRSETRSLPAVTADGATITLLANIGSLAEAKVALERGAKGVGLFRTEFLFGGRDQLPTEDEQFRVYRQVAEMFAPNLVVIRTLDAGGDKPITGIHTSGPASEMNPFLGLRGVRLTLDMPELFRTQLRAILRAAIVGNVWVMFPMVTAVDEIHACRAILNDAINDLSAQGIAHSAQLPVGMMVEVPAAAIACDLFADDVDFFSIGTNDLAQYTLAADRTNASVSRRFDPLHPAVLRLIHGVVSAGNAHNRHVAVCGEMAGDVSAIPTLIGLGIRELSMTASSIPSAKLAIRELNLNNVTATANRHMRAGRVNTGIQSDL